MPFFNNFIDAEIDRSPANKHLSSKIKMSVSAKFDIINAQNID